MYVIVQAKIIIPIGICISITEMSMLMRNNLQPISYQSLLLSSQNFHLMTYIAEC